MKTSKVVQCAIAAIMVMSFGNSVFAYNSAVTVAKQNRQVPVLMPSQICAGSDSMSGTMGTTVVTLNGSLQSATMALQPGSTYLITVTCTYGNAGGTSWTTTTPPFSVADNPASPGGVSLKCSSKGNNISCHQRAQVSVSCPASVPLKAQPPANWTIASSSNQVNLTPSGSPIAAPGGLVQCVYNTANGSGLYIQQACNKVMGISSAVSWVQNNSVLCVEI
jgi:hypothetical protein